MCEDDEPGTILMGKTIFDFKHVITNRYLYTDKRYEFNNQNCGRDCPILGQLEVAADRYPTASTKWKVNSVEQIALEFSRI